MRFALLWLGAAATGGYACRLSYGMGRLRGRRDAEHDLAELAATVAVHRPVETGWAPPGGHVIDLNAAESVEIL